MGKDFQDSVNVLFDKIEDLVSSKTVIGEPIVIGDLTLLPLIDVSVGAGAGAKENINAAGGVGAKITPAAILMIQNGSAKLINIKNQDAITKLIDMAPSVAEKLNFGAVFGGRNKEAEVKEAPPTPFEEEIKIEPFESK